MEGKGVFLENIETQPLGRRERGKGMPCADAEGHRRMVMDRWSGFIPAPALQPGWRSKLGLVEGLGSCRGRKAKTKLTRSVVSSRGPQP